MIKSIIAIVIELAIILFICWLIDPPSSGGISNSEPDF